MSSNAQRATLQRQDETGYHRGRLAACRWKAELLKKQRRPKSELSAPPWRVQTGEHLSGGWGHSRVRNMAVGSRRRLEDGPGGLCNTSTCKSWEAPSGPAVLCGLLTLSCPCMQVPFSVRCLVQGPHRALFPLVI